MFDRKEYYKKYYQEHKENIKNRMEKYHNLHKEHYNNLDKKYRKEYEGHIGIKGIKKPSWYKTRISLWKRYGIKLIPPYITYWQEYATYYIKAGKKCEICGKPLRMWYSAGISPEKYKDMETASFDHEHKTGLPRGILCRNCNYVVGIVERRLNGNAKNVSIYISKSDKNGKL